ncbi:DUF4280 domain-containing protein [uncultured Chryseobacterium sp.]|uniref:DUF4280 domain-containing protein n=1 Tax=uncultured Chryseobacterium sp. TaxID=259322 RepID=UPI0025D6FBCB|nr:DUF4280 domain-containing protein [uncultured Chryseobacterium sp.]
MPAKITEQAKMTCDKGSSPSQLTVTSQTFWKAENKLIATEMDRQPDVNIPAFGSCSITQKDCRPAPSSWINTAVKDTVNGNKILTDASTCACSLGGKISFTDKGYTEKHEIL